MATVVGRLIRIVEHVLLQEGQQAIVSSRTGLDINSDEFVFGTVTVNGSAKITLDRSKLYLVIVKNKGNGELAVAGFNGGWIVLESGAAFSVAIRDVSELEIVGNGQAETMILAVVQ